MGMNGADVLLLVNTGTESVPVWTAVGSQRDMSRQETNDEIDFSSKDQREARVGAGRYGSSMSLDALYVPSDTAFQALKAALRAGDLILVRVEEAGTAIEQASALITSMSEEWPDQGEATISIDLTIDGAWTELTS